MLTTTICWQQGPESFLAQLDSEQDGPEVIWNLEMKQRLLDHLTSELESYVKFRAADPLALYIHVPKSPLTYPELEGNCLSPFVIPPIFITILCIFMTTNSNNRGNREPWCKSCSMWTDLTCTFRDCVRRVGLLCAILYSELARQ